MEQEQEVEALQGQQGILVIQDLLDQQVALLLQEQLVLQDTQVIQDLLVRVGVQNLWVI
jgi:hypothetical protein